MKNTVTVTKIVNASLYGTFKGKFKMFEVNPKNKFHFLTIIKLWFKWQFSHHYYEFSIIGKNQCYHLNTQKVRNNYVPFRTFLHEEKQRLLIKKAGTEPFLDMKMRDILSTRV